MKVLEATAITKVYGEGQKTIGVSLLYDRVRTEEEVRNTEYTVEGRNIREIFVNCTGKMEERETEGAYVILKLDRWDPEASTKTMEGKGRDSRVRRVSPSLRIRQGKESFSTDRERNLTADQFRPFIFRVPETGKELAYNLFVPEGMEAGRQYPLVLFMHDAGSCSEEMQTPLIQGNGATVWAEEEAQKRHPCFVLAPRYPEVAAADDFTVTWEADATVELVKEIVEKYPVDKRRVYGTGQSMGCMMLCELSLRNPGFFAGCFLVAGQWNPDTMAKARKENLWILVSEKDEKAFPIMGACMEQIEKAGGRVTRGELDGTAPMEEQNRKMREYAGRGNHILFTWYQGDTVMSGQKAEFPGAYHMATWEKAYSLTAVQDWLFAQKAVPMDFSCKHPILLKGEDGALLPMDVPYFESRKVAPGTWQILSDGDYTYLAEGEKEALVIDSGYGCGNIRAYCQSLTEKPVWRIANTHDHFDHTANNGYFDRAYMSEETRKLATIPFPSFSGIEFPRDYPVQVIEEGYRFQLGGRELLTFSMPDHAPGSLAFLDRREGILFCGDELCMPFGKPLNGSVKRFRGYLKKLEPYRKEIRLLCGGPGIEKPELIDRLAENMDYILEGHEGKRMEPAPEGEPRSLKDGPVIYSRRLPHEPDRHREDPADQPYKRVMEYAGCRVIYDIRRVWED